MTQTYNADAIEVLISLSHTPPPGDGYRYDPPQLIWASREAIDNSVDEVLAGHAKRVDVILHADQSLEVISRRTRDAGGYPSGRGFRR